MDLGGAIALLVRGRAEGQRAHACAHIQEREQAGASHLVGGGGSFGATHWNRQLVVSEELAAWQPACDPNPRRGACVVAC